MRRYDGVIALALGASMAIAGCGRESAPPVSYAPEQADYHGKMDFARLEHELPLKPTDRMKITPKNLEGATQEQVDQIYARLTAGPIPNGAFNGQFFFPRGRSGSSRISEIAGGGLGGLAIDLKSAKLEHVGEAIWKGKVFYKNQRVLRNRINDLAILRPLVGPDIGTIQKIEVDEKDAWLLFPAKLYCGQSLLDGRRESIIIDYAFTDDIDGYRKQPDFLAGREGFEVRDEIRMVRPGFYLGRAYMKRFFMLNFTLYNKEIAEKEVNAFAKPGNTDEECWGGPQRLVDATK
jgi:hypothetical protein